MPVFRCNFWTMELWRAAASCCVKLWRQLYIHKVAVISPGVEVRWLISIKRICCRFGESGRQSLAGSPGKFATAWLSTTLRDSKGGVGAKIASSPGKRISRATSLLRIRGLR